MARTKVTVQIQKTGNFRQDLVVLLNETYVKKMKIPARELISLRFGAYRTEAKVLPVKSIKGIKISEKVAERLSIKHGASLGLNFKPDTQTLSFGPLVGIMMSRVYSSNAERPFGNMTAFCREISESCREHGAFAYFFTPNDIGDSADSLKGWRLENGSWRHSSFPAPDVVYNRLTSRKLENKPRVQHFLKEVKSRYNANVFNEKYLDKTEVFEALAHDSALKSFLPESHALKNFQILKSMCKKHRVVFLKPNTGSLGKGIIRITRTPEGYDCHATTLNGMVKHRFSRLIKLFQAISGKIKRNRYQIQQGLNLITVDGRPVDFRALVQKNGNGEWVITSIVGRIASTNHYVSNLARGGMLSPVGRALAKSNLGSGQYAKYLSRLRRAALLLARGVEQHVAGHYGELGIDLAIDTSGKIWLLEINSKPSKDDNATTTNKVRPSVRLLVQYACYLAKH